MGKGVYLLPILTSIFFYYWPELLVMIAPLEWDVLVMKLIWPPHSRPNDPDYWAEAPILSEILPTRINNRSEIFHPVGYPVIVRNWMDAPDPDKLFKRLSEANKGKKVRVLDFGMKTQKNESHIVNCKGSGPFAKEPVVMNFEDFIAEMDIRDNLYAGFEMITDVEVCNEIMGCELRDLHPGYRQNNIFVSQFQKTIISAAFHCAPVQSLTFQLVGTKTWLMASPEQLATLHNIPMPTFFPVGYNDNIFLETIKEFKVARVGPGDAFYFGANWCHAVITNPGPNAMFNLRFDGRDQVVNGPKSLKWKIYLRQLTRSFGSNPQENRVKQGPIFKYVTEMYENCGPSNTLEALVSRFRTEEEKNSP